MFAFRKGKSNRAVQSSHPKSPGGSNIEISTSSKGRTSIASVGLNSSVEETRYSKEHSFDVESCPTDEGLPIDEEGSTDMSLYTTQSKATVRYPPRLLNYCSDDDDDASNALSEFTSELVLNRYGRLGGGWSPPAPLCTTSSPLPTKDKNFDAIVVTPQTDAMSSQSSLGEEDSLGFSDTSVDEDETACSLLPATARMAKLMLQKRTAVKTTARTKTRKDDTTRSPGSPFTPNTSILSRSGDLQYSTASAAQSLQPAILSLTLDDQTPAPVKLDDSGAADATMTPSSTSTVWNQPGDTLTSEKILEKAKAVLMRQHTSSRQEENIILSSRDDDTLGFSLDSKQSDPGRQVPVYKEQDSLTYSIQSVDSDFVSTKEASAMCSTKDDDSYGYTIASGSVADLRKGSHESLKEHILEQWDEDTYGFSDASMLSVPKALAQGSKRSTEEDDSLSISIQSSLSRSRSIQRSTDTKEKSSNKASAVELKANTGSWMPELDARGDARDGVGQVAQTSLPRTTIYCPGSTSTDGSSWKEPPSLTRPRAPADLLSSPTSKREEDAYLLSSALLYPGIVADETKQDPARKIDFEAEGQRKVVDNRDHKEVYPNSPSSVAYDFLPPGMIEHDESGASILSELTPGLDESTSDSNSIRQASGDQVEHSTNEDSMKTLDNPEKDSSSCPEDEATKNIWGQEQNVGFVVKEQGSESPKAEPVTKDKEESFAISPPSPIIREDEEADPVWADYKGDEVFDYVKDMGRSQRLADDDKEVLNRSYLQAMESISFSLRSPNQVEDWYFDSETYKCPGSLLLTTEELRKHLKKAQKEQPFPSSDIKGYDDWRRRKEEQRLYFARLQKKADRKSKAMQSTIDRFEQRQQERDAIFRTDVRESTDHPSMVQHINAGNSQSRRNGRTKSNMQRSIDRTSQTRDSTRPLPPDKEGSARGKGRWGWLTFSRNRKDTRRLAKNELQGEHRAPETSPVPKTTKKATERKEINVVPLSQFMRISTDEPTEVGEFSMAPLNKDGPMTLASTAMPDSANTLAATRSHYLNGAEGNPRYTARRLLEDERHKQQIDEVRRFEDEEEERERIARRKQEALEKQRRMNLPQPERPSISIESLPRPKYPTIDARQDSKDSAETPVTAELSFSSKTSGSSGKSRSSRALALCTICDAGERTHIAMPCMHFAFCENCVQGFQKINYTTCPICTRAHVSFAKVYTG